MKRINDTWLEWLSRMLFGTRWTTVREGCLCLSCNGVTLRDRPVATNNATATNLALLSWGEARILCAHCNSPYVMWTRRGDSE